MTIIDFFKAVSEDAKISYCRNFWDENIYGKKPDTFFVYRLNSSKTIVNSEETTEVESKSFLISIFTKTALIDDLKIQIIDAVLKNGGKALDEGFEDYERETRYTHSEISVTIYY